MDKTKIIDALKTHEVFESLTQTEIEQVADITEQLDHGKNEIIYTVDQTAGYLHYILDGKFEVRLTNNTQIYLSKGSIFGEIGMLYPVYRTGSVVASEASSTLRISGNQIFNEELISAKTALKIVRVLAKRIIKYLRKKENVSSIEIIHKGEAEFTEFKSTLRWNLHSNKKDKKIEQAILKSIAGFLNSKGGVLFIGVGDDGTILGLDNDRFENHDKYFLHLGNIIKTHLGTIAMRWIQYSIEEVDGKEFCRVDCLPASQPIYYLSDQEDCFYLRTGASTTQLRLSRVHSYIQERFYRDDMDSFDIET